MKKFKFLAVALIGIAAICYAPVMHAQDSAQLVLDTALHDTASQIPGATGPVFPANNIAGIPLPAWAQTALIALFTILPAVQLVLKRIPTAYSVKIGGVMGKILDVLTFFQKDRTSNGGVHV